jgi:hypothetical protein
MRDRLPYGLGIRRMQAADRLTLSLGSLHACCLGAHAPLNLETHWAFVRTNFSGGVCSDAVHDRGRTMLCATAPLGDLTVSCHVVETQDQDPMDTLVQALNDRGLPVPVALTAGAPLSTDRLPRSWADIAPPRCILPVSKEVKKLRRDGGRALKNRRKLQGHKGRKKRRGRPSQNAHKQRPYRQGMRQQEQATVRWDPPSLIVRQPDARSAQDKEDLTLMVQLAPERTLLRPCHQQVSRLCARGLSKPCARSRRRRLVTHASYQANAFLAKALKKLRTDKFANLIVFLGWEKGERTNHQVESNTRGCRMMQQTRYKRRQVHTLEKALELELYARMLEHPSYSHNVREVPILGQETALLQMAA